MRSAGAGQHKGQRVRQERASSVSGYVFGQAAIADRGLCAARKVLYLVHTFASTHPFRRVTGSELPTAESECDVDGGFNFYGLVVEQVGAVAPGLDGVNRRLTKHEWATYYIEILDAAGGRDSGGENNCAGDARGARDDGIDGVGFGEDHSLGDAGRYGHRMS